MKRIATLFVITLVFVSGIASAASGKSRQSKPYSPPPGKAMYSKMVELSEEEQKKLYESKMEYQKILIPLRAEIRVLNLEINQMIAAGKSAKDLQGHVDKLNALKSKQNSERIAHQIEMRKILGEEKYLQMGRYQRYAGSRNADGPRMMRQDNKGRNYQEDCPYYKKTGNNRYYRNKK
jgi:hypothetical protein